MRAFNKRLDHKTEIRSIDFEKNKIRLVQPDSKPTFVYEENLDNVEIQDFTGVYLNKKPIYVGDVIINKKKQKFLVEKVPGGYFPFVEPVSETFRKVN